MSLKDIFEQLQEWCAEHDYDEDFDEFDELCCNIMSVNQTYFQWDVDGDCFELDTAFDTVMNEWKSGKKIKDFYIDYLVDDKLMILVEYDTSI